MGATAALGGALATLVAGGATAYSMHQAAKDRDKEADRQKKEDKINAKMQKDKTRRLLGMQRAAYGKAGVNPDVGSPLAVIEDTRDRARRERDYIKKGKLHRAEALETEADRLRTNSMFAVGGSLLKGTSSYAASPYAKNPFV